MKKSLVILMVSLYMIFSFNPAMGNEVKKPINSFLNKKPRGITILMYHSINTPASSGVVPPEIFAEQMKYLYYNGFHTITLNEYFNYKKNNQPLPEKSLIITFDDGNIDNYTYAFPILVKYNFKSIIFITTDFVGKEKFLTWDMIREMYRSGYVDIGGHTLSHPHLTELSTKQQEEEIFESKKIIEENIAAPIKFFAYPYGQRNSSAVKVVKRAGYKGAVITSNGTGDNRVSRSTDAYLISRTFIGGRYSIKSFTKRIDGFPKIQAPGLYRIAVKI